jgi:hypothetical protein
MREGKAGVSTREGRVRVGRNLEEAPRLVVIGFGKPIHVPQPPVVRLPGVERIWGFSTARLRSAVSIS